MTQMLLRAAVPWRSVSYECSGKPAARLGSHLQLIAGNGHPRGCLLAGRTCHTEGSGFALGHGGQAGLDGGSLVLAGHFCELPALIAPQYHSPADPPGVSPYP